MEREENRFLLQHGSNSIQLSESSSSDRNGWEPHFRLVSVPSELERSIGPQIIEMADASPQQIVNGRARNILARLHDRRRIASIPGHPGQFDGETERRSAIVGSIPPQFEVNRPPKAPFIGLTGNENDRFVLSGVAFAVEVELVTQPNSTPISFLHQLFSLSCAFSGLRLANSPCFNNQNANTT